jgi:cholest-4-en-3-one 26-monooxygenase
VADWNVFYFAVRREEIRMRAPEFDLYSPDTWRNGVPHDALAWLRREDPVHFHKEPEGPGFWAITKHADIIRISKDPKTFSSWLGATNIEDRETHDLAITRMLMVNMDPPDHGKYRRLVRSGFTPQRVAKLEPHVRDLAAEIIDKVASKGECDFVTEIAAELPLLVIAELMGVPIADRHRIFDLTNRLIGFDDPEFQTSMEDGRIAAAEMWAYAQELGDQRRKNPRDDLISTLVHAEVDGEGLSHQQFNNFFLLLAVAGNETTRNLMAGGMLALMEHPDQRQRLLDDPGLIPTAVEELLRWVSPLIYFRRTATRDVELRGKKISEGEKVALYYTSGNRDEEVFDEPFTFDVGRRDNHHLAFGIGEHVCVGAHLARLEIRVMFEELLRRLPDMELTAPVKRLRSNFINGIKEMRVRYTPDAP